MILPVEDSLHLEFWGSFRGYIDARDPRGGAAAALPAAAFAVCWIAGCRYPSDDDGTSPKELYTPNQQEVV